MRVWYYSDRSTMSRKTLKQNNALVGRKLLFFASVIILILYTLHLHVYIIHLLDVIAQKNSADGNPINENKIVRPLENRSNDENKDTSILVVYAGPPFPIYNGPVDTCQKLRVLPPQRSRLQKSGYHHRYRVL